MIWAIYIYFLYLFKQQLCLWFYSILFSYRIVTLSARVFKHTHRIMLVFITNHTFTFMHLADAFIQSDLQLHSGYTFFLISMCVPWESNPQPFALQMQCSTTEPHRNILSLTQQTSTTMTSQGLLTLITTTTCQQSAEDLIAKPPSRSVTQYQHWKL